MMDFNTAGRNIKAVLSPTVYPGSVDVEAQRAIVTSALENPVGSVRLATLTRGVKRLLVITSDHTRPVPSKVTLPLILDEARRDNPDVEIRILIATGLHRQTTPAEMDDKFGQSLIENECFVKHNCRDDGMVFKGILPSGGELWLNGLVDWAELVISEGFIEPHFFAGFSGGRKSILPGIASEKTVRANHCSAFIASEQARTGNLYKNPIHKDMLFAARQAGLAFICNVVIDSEKNIIEAFAGDPGTAHSLGCDFVSDMASVKAVAGDIAVTSNGGYPMDQNIYQAVKSMTAAEACVRKGGVIIVAAECIDGHGGESFYRYFADAASPGTVVSRIEKVSQADTEIDQWEAQVLARVLLHANVILVSDKLPREITEAMHMMSAKTLDEAYDKALGIVGENAETVVIPDGIGVIVR